MQSFPAWIILKSHYMSSRLPFQIKALNHNKRLCVKEIRNCCVLCRCCLVLRVCRYTTANGYTIKYPIIKTQMLIPIGGCILICVLRICVLAGGQLGLMGRPRSWFVYFKVLPQTLDVRLRTPKTGEGMFLNSIPINKQRAEPSERRRSNPYLLIHVWHLTLTRVTTATIEGYVKKIKSFVFLHSDRPLTRPDALTSSMQEQ